MPFIHEKEWQDIKKRVDSLEERLKKHDDFLRDCKGKLTIYGSNGKRFDLNENLNVIELLKSIKSKQDEIRNTLTLTVSGNINFRLRGTSEPRIYLEMTTDGGVTWNEFSSWPT